MRPAVLGSAELQDKSTDHRLPWRFAYSTKDCAGHHLYEGSKTTLALSALCSSANAAQLCLSHMQTSAALFYSPPCLSCFPQCSASKVFSSPTASILSDSPQNCSPQHLSFNCTMRFLDSSLLSACPVWTRGCRRRRFEGLGGCTNGHISSHWQHTAHGCKADKRCVCSGIPLTLLPAQRGRIEHGLLLLPSGHASTETSKIQHF